MRICCIASTECIGQIGWDALHRGRLPQELLSLMPFARYLPSARNGKIEPPPAAPGSKSFDWHVGFLTLGLAVLALLYIGFLLYRFAEGERMRIEQEAQSLARFLSNAVDREVSGVATTLQALATSPSLQGSDIGDFYRQGQAILAQQGIHISIRRADGRMVMTTRAAAGAPIPLVPSDLLVADDFARVSGKPYVSDVFTGPLTGRANIQIMAPVLTDTFPQRVVGASLEPDFFRDALRRFDVPPGWVASVSDRRGLLVAATENREAQAAQPVSEEFARRAGGDKGFYYGAGVSSGAALIAWQRSAETGWRVAVTVPVAQVNAALRQSVAMLALAGLVLGVAATLMSIWIRGRMKRALQAVEGLAGKVAEGETPAPVATPVTDLTRIGYALSTAAARRRTSEERLQQLASSGLMGILFGDVHGGISFANDAFLETIGRTRAEFLNGVIRWDEITPAEWLPVDAAHIREAQEHGSCTPYEKEYLRPDGSRVPVLVGFALSGPQRDQSVAFILDISVQKNLQEQQKLLLHELHHRVKNTLATVQSIANSSTRHARDFEEFRLSFAERISALARSHTLLMQHDWREIELRELLVQETQAYASAGRVLLDGPVVALPPQMALALGLAVHELVTNAAKYGGLSVPDGKLRVTWNVMPVQDAPRLTLHWRESGGPPVTPPTRKGFGSQLLQRVLGAQIGGKAEMDYAPDGLRVTIEAPVMAHDPDTPSPLPAPVTASLPANE